MTTWERLLCWAVGVIATLAVVWLTNREATPKWDDNQTLDDLFNDEG